MTTHQRSGRAISPTRTGRGRADPALDGLIRSWLARYDSLQTQCAYRNDLIRWMHWCDEHQVPVLGATGQNINEYRRSEPCDALSNGERASTSTISRRLASLSSFYRHCVGEGAMERNPVDNVRLNRSASRAAARQLNNAETQQMLDAAALCGPREFVIISLQVIDGLRARELLTLDRARVDLDSGPTIHIDRADGRVDDVGISVVTAAALAQMLEHEPDGWLFHTQAGEPVRRQYVYQVVRRVARRAGITTTVSCQSLHQTFLAACDAALRGPTMADGRIGDTIDLYADDEEYTVLELPNKTHRTRLPAASAS